MARRKGGATSGGGVCVVCGAEFPRLSQAKVTCSAVCLAARRELRSSGGLVAAAAPVVSLEGSVTSRLVAAGVEGTPLGVSVTLMARRLDNGDDDSAAGLAALVRELKVTLAEALGQAVRVSDPVDELRRRRDAKRG